MSRLLTSIQHLTKFQRFYSNDFLRVDTKTAKDVLLFKYENPKYYKILNLFALTQFGFWSYLAHFAFTTLKDVPVEKVNPDDPWYKRINLGENKYRYGITIFSLLIGHGMLIGSWTFTLRSVRFLVLRKGGSRISLVTYTPFGKNRIMDVPVQNVSAAESRSNARVQLPIKVKGKYLYYMLDMKGEFLNKNLFDATAGMYRKL